mmetsp:Transcript_13477/g.18463  ORF Transcript_13477/g.18463 Transcript_13477/m.18463 type:complete len:152 (+) Transcript_13477:108-563(+)|eukprot:CAMPEP_0196583162 /NCGR_PEP_ID=MMETSP1081-20130531/42318_1 /TAXON_ID=36882 /ORGANISM="Pyramimonas amylifera, Strain CCMP720" /LENGTH=151 /DNA_ID=CAMNT_0041903965 /DNA_START=107 /DNA_END=565 /DNA_ORIENTATION=+
MNYLCLSGTNLRIALCPSERAGGRGPRQGTVFRKLPRSLQICKAESASSAKHVDVEVPDVRRLAYMAKLEVSDEEVADWTPKLEQIATWFSELSMADVEGVPPALRAGEYEGACLGEDIPSPFQARDELLSATEMQDGYVKVPKVLGESEG